MKRRRILWGVWLFAALALWFFENNAATLALLLASALLPFLSIRIAKRNAKGASYRIEAPEEAEKGTDIPVSVRVRTGTLPGSRVRGIILCENRLTGERTETPVAGSGETLFLRSAFAGTLRLSADIRTEDLFGLWQSGPVKADDVFVTVRPRLFPAEIVLTEQSAVLSDSERYSRTKPGSDPSETFAIREYRPGDPIRQIHWKLSGKTDEMMVRELGLPIASRTLLVHRNVLPGGGTVAPATADAVLEIVLSIARGLTEEGNPFTAAFAENGRFTLIEVENDSDAHMMADRLLTVRWEADDGALARLLNETPYAHIVLVGAAFPPEAEAHSVDSRVTVIMPDPADVAPGVSVLPFTADGYPAELSRIEL